MLTRKKKRLDYTVYNKTGRKVLLEGGTDMDLHTVLLEEQKIVEDIGINFDLYDLDELYDEKEISEAIEIMSDSCKNYRHCHVELKNNLEDKYEGKFPNYDNIVKELTSYIKSAKNELRKVKNENETKQCSKETNYLEIKFDVLNSPC